MVNDFVAREDLSLFTSGPRFTLAKVFLGEKMENYVANFDLLVRELPAARNYLVFAGLEHVVAYLLNLRFNREQCAWIKRSFGFSREVMKYFENFRFRGDVWAMPEGSIFFPQEPVIRVSAPIIEAQFIEMYLINTVYVQTILATKIARFVAAANGKSVIIGWNRSYGSDTAMKSARINEIFGNASSLSLYHYKHASHVFSTSTFHYLIMAFKNEQVALEAYLRQMDGHGYVLVDTYNTARGIDNFIQAAKVVALEAYLRQMDGHGYVLVDTYNTARGIDNFIQAAKVVAREGIRPVGIQLDSGDLYSLSRLARRKLDAAGLRYVKIFAMSNLNEHRVAELERRQAPIDVYAGVTDLLTPPDAPTLELVYKLSELRQGKFVVPKMKTSSKKASLPGRKQVFRFTGRGKYTHDVIALDSEHLKHGRPLLVPIIQKGKLVRRLPGLTGIRSHYQNDYDHFSTNLHSFNKKVNYPVSVSTELKQLVEEARRAFSSDSRNGDV